MKHIAALVATAVLLATVLSLGRGRSNRQGPASPSECLTRMFSAAEQGDLAAYLNCFTGPQRERIERELSGQSAEEFAAALRDAVRTLKGRAVSGSDDVKPDAHSATLTVERIYGQHAERQSYHFVRQSDNWQIDSVGAVEKHQPPVPYGTPVFKLPAAIDEADK